MRFTLALFLLPSLACGPLSEHRPYLAVDPPALHLTGAQEGGTSSAPLTLLNLGAVPLRVTARTISGAGFTIEGCRAPLSLAPLSDCTAEVRFSPDAGGSPSTGHVTLQSNDPDQPAVHVTLTAPSSLPVLAVSPAQITFGAVASGKTASQRIHIVNLGRATATGLSLAWTPTDSDFGGSLPVTELPPGETTEMMVSYSPTGGDLDQTSLTITSTNCDSRVINLSGYQDLTAPH